MSRDDSQLQIKSLEQILQLGHTIAQQEAKKHASPTNNTSAAVTTNAGRKSTPKRTNRTPSPVATRHVRVPDSNSARRVVPVDAAVGVSRLAKVPGLTPAPTTGKANKVQ